VRILTETSFVCIKFEASPASQPPGTVQTCASAGAAALAPWPATTIKSANRISIMASKVEQKTLEQQWLRTIKK
jgi:hypothetical protein